MLEALLGKKSVRPKIFSPKLRNLFTFYVLADRIPSAGKSQNTGGLGHFGLGQPLALTEIMGETTDYQESTQTRPIADVKPAQAQVVLRWATTWEHWVKVDQNQFFQSKLTQTSFFSVKIDQNQFFWPKPMKTSFSGQH